MVRNMSLSEFGFVADGGSAESAVDLAVAAHSTPAAVVPASQSQDEVPAEGEPQATPVDTSLYVFNSSLKAYSYTHAGWKRSLDKKSALCPVANCGMVVQTAGNTTNLEAHTRRHDAILFDEQKQHKAQLTAGNPSYT